MYRRGTVVCELFPLVGANRWLKQAAQLTASASPCSWALLFVRSNTENLLLLLLILYSTLRPVAISAPDLAGAETN